MGQVSITDLHFARSWIGACDPRGDAADAERVQRVLAWLKAEIVQRERDAALRFEARKRGVSLTIQRQAQKLARLRKRDAAE